MQLLKAAAMRMDLPLMMPKLVTWIKQQLRGLIHLSSFLIIMARKGKKRM